MPEKAFTVEPAAFDREDLARAIEGREFELHLQPQVSLRDDTVIGVEALARWKWGGEWISPSDFVPKIEEYGLVDEFLLAILAVVVKDAGGRKFSKGFKISVNVSASQVRPGLAELAESFLDKSGFPVQHLAFEITETVMMHDIKTAVKVVKALNDLGLAVYIDDFGTGHCSLQYLSRLKVQGMKIPQEFIRSVHQDKMLTVVIGLCRIARDLKLKLVAEGVETDEQRRILSALAIDCFQGYLHSRPLPAESFYSKYLK